MLASYPMIARLRQGRGTPLVSASQAGNTGSIPVARSISRQQSQSRILRIVEKADLSHKCYSFLAQTNVSLQK